MERTSGKKVNVEMGNGFSTVGPVIDDNAEAIGPEFFSEFACGLEEMAEKLSVFGVGLAEAWDGLSWDD